MFEVIFGSFIYRINSLIFFYFICISRAPRSVALQGYGMTEGFISISPQEIANYQSWISVHKW